MLGRGEARALAARFAVDTSGAGFRGFGTGITNRRRFPLTLRGNPLPYGCECTGYNVCGFVRSDPAGNGRATLAWACLCAWLDGAVCTFAADDFKTHRLPGAGADRGQDEAWTRECVHAEARGDQDSQRLGDEYRRFWEESFDKLDVVVKQMKKEVRDDRQHG